MVAAATKIQAVHRGRAARKELGSEAGAGEKSGDGEAAAAEAPAAAEEEELVPVAELGKDEGMVAAATKIQAVHRGRAARKELGSEAGAGEGGGEGEAAAAEAPAAAEEEELVPVAELEKDEGMVAAATKIQAVHRG